MHLNSQNALPIEFTQGDIISLPLIATDNQGNPVNLTGYNLQTQIQGPNSIGPITFPNSQHTIADQTTSRGKFALALASADTAACGEGAAKEIITEGTKAGVVTFFRGNNLLSVFPSSPEQ